MNGFSPFLADGAGRAMPAEKGHVVAKGQELVLIERIKA